MIGRTMTRERKDGRISPLSALLQANLWKGLNPSVCVFGFGMTDTEITLTFLVCRFLCFLTSVRTGDSKRWFSLSFQTL